MDISHENGIMVYSLNDKIISHIQQIGQKYEIDKIILFGSRARGDYKRNSDIDLAVFPLPGFNKAGYLASDIDDLETLLKIDVVFINKNTDAKLMENIQREGVTLYERFKK